MNVVEFPQRRTVPPFDPANPAHVAAWENLWLAGQEFLRLERKHGPMFRRRETVA